MAENNGGTLIGTLPRDPKVFPTSKSKVARLTIEVPRSTGKSRDFIDVVAFGKQAEDIERWGQAGAEVKVTFSLQSGRFERNGQSVFTQDVVLSQVAFTAGAKTVAEQAAATEEVAEEVAPEPAKPKRRRAAAKPKAKAEATA